MGGVGLCILAAPEIVVGAVVAIGVVVVAVAIDEALDAYERRGRVEPEASREATGPAPQPQPIPQEPLASRRPKPEPTGQDWPPPLPPDPLARERRPECKPIPVPHMGGNGPHNECADKIPQNSFPGWDVLVNGKNFDGLQLSVSTLWDVKTDDFDKHSPRSQTFFVRMKLPEIQRERDLARACGYHFVVGVRSQAHREALLRADNTLDVVVMDWC